MATSALKQTHAPSRLRQLFFDLVRTTWQCPCFSGVLEATHEARLMAIQGRRVAKKSVQGSDTERRDFLRGMEEKSISPMRGHWFALQANQYIFLTILPPWYLIAYDLSVTNHKLSSTTFNKSSSLVGKIRIKLSPVQLWESLPCIWQIWALFPFPRLEVLLRHSWSAVGVQVWSLTQFHYYKNPIWWEKENATFSFDDDYH